MLSRVLVATTLALSALVATAGATPGPADDRLIQTPTGWHVDKNQTTADVQAIVDDDTYRITDLRIEGKSPMRYSSTRVKNTGDYRVTGSFFFYGITYDDAMATFAANNKRPVVMRAYTADGVTKYAGITVPNTGANHRNWTAFRGSYDYVTTHMPDGYRPMIIDTFINPSGDRHYLIVAVENTENYGWWWWFGLSAAELDAKQNPYKSLIDASCDDDNAMDRNVILYALPTTHGVVQGVAEYDTSWTDLWNDAVNWLSRPLFMTHYTLHGSGTSDGETEWMSSFVDNF